MKKVLHWLDENFEPMLASIFLLGMLTLGFIQIFCRYLPISPFAWTEELIRYLFIWMVFVLIGYAVRTDEHIRITFLKAVLPRNMQLVLDIFSSACCVLFALLCMKEGLAVTALMLEKGQMAVTMPNFPLWLTYLVMPLSFIGITIRGIQRIVLTAREFGKKEEV